MTRDMSLYIADILSNMDDVIEYVEGMQYEQFVKDSRTIKAVIRSIEVIGEAVKNLSSEVKSLKPDVPWRDMARMRDKCIHFYFGVDQEVVWLAAKTKIPELRPMIAELLQIVRKDR
jgi:uncharacterized protein with HEPN domain